MATCDATGPGPLVLLVAELAAGRRPPPARDRSTGSASRGARSAPGVRTASRRGRRRRPPACRALGATSWLPREPALCVARPDSPGPRAVRGWRPPPSPGAPAGPAGGGGTGSPGRHRRPARARRAAALGVPARAGLVIDHRAPARDPTTTSTRPSSPAARGPAAAAGSNRSHRTLARPPPAIAAIARARPAASTATAPTSSVPATACGRSPPPTCPPIGSCPADVSDVEVAPYWVAVVAANRGTAAVGRPEPDLPGRGARAPTFG